MTLAQEGARLAIGGRVNARPAVASKVGARVAVAMLGGDIDKGERDVFDAGVTVVGQSLKAPLALLMSADDVLKLARQAKRCRTKETYPVAVQSHCM